MSDLTFGECEGLCGRMVERVGWDRFCFDCEQEMREQEADSREHLSEEDVFLYGGGVAAFGNVPAGLYGAEETR